MPPIDPSTGQPLPESTIQRILFTHHPVHVYGIPPLTSTSGFSASSWTSPTKPTAQQIFTARLQVIETSYSETSLLKCAVVLSDPTSGDLFAAAPYTAPAAVQQANDSSRFFAIRVVGEGGMKATLGIGFEERGAAFDFGIALTEARKVLGMSATGEQQNGGPRGRATELQKKMEVDAKKDFSLKEGEKIVVNVPGAAKGRRQKPETSASGGGGGDAAALFSIAPPPPAAGTSQNNQQKTAADDQLEGKTAQELGFDDGEFGEFQ
ncbi:hypothetical protein CKM354_000506700 [Cercospora kikuchii]|uniref:NECAP PHear domain-containing protein n=1 Tax=Cercospora kikuchii TaxID=84275 RepID=A0A9P3CEJ0_9PEZI|nr:uncharacterized protein CKM354_000506700 [Cercospora kikuchii]GIZ41772.1 hypothetical protein CKM354_000506700 [Cercospora kikuchii]